MKIRSKTLVTGSLPALAAAVLCTPGAQAQINPGGYTCSATYSKTHNTSLAITVRTLTCNLPTSMIHWYNLAIDADLAGQYSTLTCVDWSLWSSSNTGPQEVFIRVFQDLTPTTRGGNCPSQGFGSTSEPGPDPGSQLLLWEGSTIFPSDPGGVAGGAPPRADGDRSILVGPDTDPSMDGLGDGILFAPDIAFFVEIAHLGEAQTRFGSNTAGEAGDGAPPGPNVTWIRAPNCSGGGCTSVCTGTNCIATPYAKHSEWIPGTNRDFVMVVHLNPGDTTPPGPLPFCPEDIVGPGGTGPDREVGIDDLLAVLASWGDLAPPRPLGDVRPLPNGDNLVDINDLLGLLGEWGPCENPLITCETVYNAFLGGGANPAVISGDGSSDFVLDPANQDGPVRGPTNDINEVLAGATTIGWANYGGGIPGGFTYGDVFGLNMFADPPLAGGDVWFHYTAPCSGRAFFEITSSCDGAAGGLLDDSILEIYSAAEGCPTSWRDHLTADDFSGNTSGGCDHALAGLTVLAGDELFIRIAGFFADTGEGTLSYTCVDNSACESALPLEIGGSTSGNTVGAPLSNPPTCGISQSFGGRWFTVIGDGNTLTASTEGTCDFEETDPETARLFDSTISVYCGTADTICEDLTCVVGDNNTGCNLHESVSWCSREGEVYYILVHGVGPENDPFFPEGFFILDVTSDDTECSGAVSCGQLRPANDRCPNATTIATGPDGDASDIDGPGNGTITNSITVNNVNATQDGHSSATCGTTGDDVWYTWTAPATVDSLVFTTCQGVPGFDSRIDVYDAALADCPTTNDSALILCDNDTSGCPGFSFNTSSGNIFGPDGGIVVFAGQTLLIRVGSPGFGVQEGAVNLQLQMNVTPSDCPFDPDCPVGATEEGGGLGETLLDDGDVDVTNGGCNMCTPAYDTILGVTDINNPTPTGATVCGQISTYQTDADLDCDTNPDGTVLNLRDTDWWTIVVPDVEDAYDQAGIPDRDGARITITLASEFPASYGIVGDTCGANPGEEVPFIASNINGGLCTEGSLTADLDAGTYRIVVTAFSTTGVPVGGGHEGHNYVLSVDPFEPAQLPPVNDSCADAVSLGANDTVVVDQRFGTNDASDPALSCGNNSGTGFLAVGSVWYTIVASDTSMQVSTCGSTIGGDSNMALYEVGNELSPCATLSEVPGACSEDDCTPFLSIFTATGLTPTEEYYLQLGAWSGGSRDAYEIVTTSPAP